ncbi:MAG TPA: RNA polymerase sigma factor [Pyrinomonadaceae bacterium]|jgi:RNA polymerase sigma-70 factor (ECF subfamily)|nr:RNA polymerase sigma factor [Pyrinomonadaceae bacterium]
MVTIDENIRLAAAGDMMAFEELYRCYRRRVYTRCLRMTRNVSEAEDLTQNVFVQLFRKLKTFRGESSFATWLHRLTVNEVLMHFRKPVVRVELTTEDDMIPTRVVVGTEDPAQMSLVDRISLDEAIRQLSPGYRAVFILHDVEGYEHQQIGRILGCAVGTSKSQLHKARMKLRRLLKKRAAPQQTSYDLNAQTLNLDLQQQMVR